MFENVGLDNWHITYWHIWFFSSAICQTTRRPWQYQQRWSVGTLLQVYHSTTSTQISAQSQRERNDQTSSAESKEEAYSCSLVFRNIRTSCKVSCNLLFSSSSSIRYRDGLYLPWASHLLNQKYLKLFCITGWRIC